MSQTAENPPVKTPKTTPERSSEKSINNNIKEKLNLHVKRRLQESGADLSLLNNNNINTTKNNNNNNEVKVRKQYTKRIEKANNPTIVRRAKRTKLKLATGSGTGTGTATTTSTVSQRDSESLGSVASTSTTTASAGDDEGSRDGNSQNPDIPHSPREKEKCPDLLNVVLNVKKRALFQNPEVIKFLHNMMDVLRQ
ncbi:anaphase-promoting complex subunit cdh1 [Eupeodes corollae]|uniref:anaphase-promoting complex subunit cdh1 n=1 Tax=Eupeodes corollae TaxID=290404 RepID=UPI0024917F53|nr:anaphase-promoting complex subunit cdh1 [Eupeodes corollae]